MRQAIAWGLGLIAAVLFIFLIISLHRAAWEYNRYTYGSLPIYPYDHPLALKTKMAFNDRLWQETQREAKMWESRAFASFVGGVLLGIAALAIYPREKGKKLTPEPKGRARAKAEAVDLRPESVSGAAEYVADYLMLVCPRRGATDWRSEAEQPPTGKPPHKVKLICKRCGYVVEESATR